MRFMKAIMAIAAICATMLTMRIIVMNSKKSSAMRKRRGMMRGGR
jgi:hypothetical protein